MKANKFCFKDLIRLFQACPHSTTLGLFGAEMLMGLLSLRSIRLRADMTDDSVPAGTNLYVSPVEPISFNKISCVLQGSHPVYFDHRSTGTHGVFLKNSNGMDININRTENGEQYLQFNSIGGIVDLYRKFAGSSLPTFVC